MSTKPEEETPAVPRCQAASVRGLSAEQAVTALTRGRGAIRPERLCESAAEGAGNLWAKPTLAA